MNYTLLIDKKNWKKLLYVSRLSNKNEKEEASYKGSDVTITVIGFYHAYCMCEGWEKLVIEQLHHICTSGLYERIEKLYIGALINDEAVFKLKEIIQNRSKYTLLYTNPDRTLFEYQTLIEMQKMCNHRDFIGFYFHTKGISWINNPLVYNIGNTWRLMAEYFMFDRYRLAIHTLNSGYDVYGTNYQEIFNDRFRIIGGNFFWFRSDYVKKLYKLKVNKQDRNESEKWILSNTHNVYCPFTFSGNTRNDIVPKELYLPCKKLMRRVIILKVYFTRFKYIFRRLLGLQVNLINPEGITKQKYDNYEK